MLAQFWLLNPIDHFPFFANQRESSNHNFSHDLDHFQLQPKIKAISAYLWEAGEQSGLNSMIMLLLKPNLHHEVTQLFIHTRVHLSFFSF